jgi:hypothetical protein
MLQLAIIECIRSDGTAINPFIITKSTRSQTSVESMAYYTHAQTPSAGTKNHVGLKWLEEHFEPSTRKHALEDDRGTLLFDSHGSHCNSEFLEFCRRNDIIPVKLPPHTSWKLQPLDVAVFGPYKQHVMKAEENWFDRFERRIKKEEFIQILMER